MMYILSTGSQFPVKVTSYNFTIVIIIIIIIIVVIIIIIIM